MVSVYAACCAVNQTPRAEIGRRVVAAAASVTFVVLVVLELGPRDGSRQSLALVASFGAALSAALVLLASESRPLGRRPPIVLLGATWMLVGSSFGRDLLQHKSPSYDCGHTRMVNYFDVWWPLVWSGMALVVLAVFLRGPRSENAQWHGARILACCVALLLAGGSMVGATRSPWQKFVSCPRPCAADEMCH